MMSWPSVFCFCFLVSFVEGNVWFHFAGDTAVENPYLNRLPVFLSFSLTFYSVQSAKLLSLLQLVLTSNKTGFIVSD